MSSLTDRLQVPPAGEAPGVRPPARTLGANHCPADPTPQPGNAVREQRREPPTPVCAAPPVLPRVALRRLSRGAWRVSYHAKSGNEHVIGRYQNHATAQNQARAYARVQDCPVEEVGA